MTDDKLPTEFFAQPAEAIGDEALQLIYSEVVARLQKENPDADTIESMMIERVAFLYVHIRHKETKKLFAHDRSHKETLQLWVTMAAQLQKKRQAELDLEEVKDRIISAVQMAVMDATEEALPFDLREEFQEKFLQQLDNAGL